MALFSVIIVNYNGGAYLQAALDSLARQTVRDFEVILVDNASTDGSLDGLRSNALPGFQLLALDDNVGFAAANNLAARQAQGRWLALLNPDAIAEPDWLEKVAEGFGRYPDTVHFACIQKAADAPELMDGAGDNYLAFGLPWRGGFGLPVEQLPQLDALCFSPCGASAILRRDKFIEFNGFDERFFCYCEDVDLGFRMQLAGHDCVLLAGAIVHHVGSALSDQVTDFAIFHGARNLVWTYWKNMPLVLLLLTLPGHIGLLTALWIRSFSRDDRQAYRRGFRAGFANILSICDRRSPWAPPRKRISVFRLVRKFAWNPLHLRHRSVVIRPLRGTPRQ